MVRGSRRRSGCRRGYWWDERGPVLAFEAHRGVGELSKGELPGWGAIVSGYRSEGWPPAEYRSLSAEEEREGSVRPASEKAVRGE